VSAVLLVTVLAGSDALTVKLPAEEAVRTPEEFTLMALLLGFQVTKLVMTVLSWALATSGTCVPCATLTVTGEGESVNEVMMVEVTKKLTLAVWPELLAVTVALPCPTASIKQAVLGSSFTAAVLLLLHVVVGVTIPPELPLTNVAVTVNCCEPVGASSTEVGLTEMLPTELGETKNPSQAVKATAKAISPHKDIRARLRRFMKFSLRS
jgi:hypothetical protein